MIGEGASDLEEEEFWKADDPPVRPGLGARESTARSPLGEQMNSAGRRLSRTHWHWNSREETQLVTLKLTRFSDMKVKAWSFQQESNGPL